MSETAENLESEIEEELETPTGDVTVESLAGKLGWAPKEEWRGDPDDWKPADEFILASKEIQSRKASENHRLKNDLNALKDQMREMADNQGKMLRKSLQEQRDRLQREFDEAVEAGDKAAARKATEDMGKLEPPEDKEAEVRRKQQEVIDLWQPHAADFESKFNDALQDEEVMMEAKSYIDRCFERGLTPEKSYELAEKKLRREFPQHFTNGNRGRPPKVGGDTSPGSGGGTNWNQLLKETPEVVDVFKQFVSQGIYKDTKEDRERYAKRALED